MNNHKIHLIILIVLNICCFFSFFPATVNAANSLLPNNEALPPNPTYNANSSHISDSTDSTDFTLNNKVIDNSDNEEAEAILKELNDLCQETTSSLSAHTASIRPKEIDKQIIGPTTSALDVSQSERNSAELIITVITALIGIGILSLNGCLLFKQIK